jgi:hypothetical protein
LQRNDFYEDAGEWNVPFDEEEVPEVDEEMQARLALHTYLTLCV